MKRIAMGSFLGLFLLGSALGANVVKFTFSNVQYPDGRVGTIQAATKTTKKGMITNCGYYSNPNDQFLGEFESDEFSSRNADEVEQFCLENYNNRQQ